MQVSSLVLLGGSQKARLGRLNSHLISTETKRPQAGKRRVIGHEQQINGPLGPDLTLRLLAASRWDFWPPTQLLVEGWAQSSHHPSTPTYVLWCVTVLALFIPAHSHRIESPLFSDSPDSTFAPSGQQN